MEDVITEQAPPSRLLEETSTLSHPPSPPPPSSLLPFTSPPSLSSPSLPSPFLIFPHSHLKPSLLIIAISSPSSPSSTLTSIPKPYLHPSSSRTPPLPPRQHLQHPLPLLHPLLLAVDPLSPPTAPTPSPTSSLETGSGLSRSSFWTPSNRGITAVDCRRTSRSPSSSRAQPRGRGRDGEKLLGELEYYPSGSVADGLGAAILGRCQILNLRASLCFLASI
ncbi:hypothetical protein SESBI_20689 [Sesbania bispinosa]|nr:hypothetical protein SESBI_20689 [Sesbania bispinosa]